MGGKRVLLTFPTKADKKDCCSLDSFMYEWFTKLMDWRATDFISEHFVWLRCHGIPLHLWSDSFFKWLVAPVGDFLTVDMNTH